MASLSKLAINQITNDPVDIRDLIEIYADAGVSAITPWPSKLEASGLDVDDFIRRVAAVGLKINGVCFCGAYGVKGVSGLQEQLDWNKQTIDFAAKIGAPSVVTLAGGLVGESKDLDFARKFNFDALAQVLEYARSVGVRLALEPLHPMYAADWSVVVGIQEANHWCDRLGDGIGVVLDLYHIWWDPELESEIARAGRNKRIEAVHVSDWLVPTKDILLDRGLMGAGVIDIPKIRAWIEKAGFDGHYEVEIFSNDLWAMDQVKFVEDIKRAFVDHV